jgi:hypothetical protein
MLSLIKLRRTLTYTLWLCGALKIQGTYHYSTSRILLLAAGRSGSTFVGEMLNQAHKSFYLYEPCRRVP